MKKEFLIKIGEDLLTIEGIISLGALILLILIVYVGKKKNV